MREGSGGEITVDHGWDMPYGVRDGLNELFKDDRDAEDKEARSMGVEAAGPFVSKRLDIKNCKYISTYVYVKLFVLLGSIIVRAHFCDL